MVVRTSSAHRRVARYLAALAASAILFGCQEPEPSDESGPSVGSGEAPAESASEPGVRETGPNQYEVVIDAFEGLYVPRNIRVPVGAEVTFRVRSKDIVIHGFFLEGTDVVFQLNPTEVTEVTHTFTEAGAYPFSCHIYCTGSHDLMRGVVTVE